MEAASSPSVLQQKWIYSSLAQGRGRLEGWESPLRLVSEYKILAQWEK